MPDIQTPYGTVDAGALQLLQQHYDTRVIQQAVDHLDALRARSGPEGLRDDLLRLHGMAHSVINGASLAHPTDDLTLPEQIDSVIEELEDWVKTIGRMLQMLRPLQDLRDLL
jgi:hypothetical protein